MNRYFVASLVIALSVLDLGITAGAALAGPRDDVLSASQRCAGIADNRRWLDCYYGAAQSMRAALGLPPAPANQTALVPPANAYIPPPASTPAYGLGAQRAAAAPSGPPPMPRHTSGFLGSMLGGGKPVVADLRMSSYDFNRDGRFTATLSDGEVWKQSDGDDARADWRAPASSYVVNVYGGALGTFNLVVGDSGTLFKVKRIK
jgi:hypothetical protein